MYSGLPHDAVSICLVTYSNLLMYIPTYVRVKNVCVTFSVVGLYGSHHTPVPLHSYKSTLIPINYTTLTEQIILASCLFQDCMCYLLISHFNLRTGILVRMSKLQNSTLTMMCHNIKSTTPRFN